MTAICHFLNVGQGTSQVIELGQQKVIIIDTGSQCGEHNSLLTLLAEREIESIEMLILSHNDIDHINGFATLLRKYSSKIKRIGFLIDREDISNIIQTLKKYHLLQSITRLEVENPNLDKNIYNNNSAQLYVKVLFPTFTANIQCQKNKTCAIIMLTVGTQKVIFSSDAPIAAWRNIIERNNNQQIKVNIMTIPHHGGRFTSVPQSHCNTFQKELIEFHTKLVKTDYAITSFASNNKYGHPCAEIIQSFIQHKIEVFCIQKATQCNGDSNICCGTITVDITANKTKIRNFDELQKHKSEKNPRLCYISTK
jgi:beta-lactamase superfamily II metal-dependent hydrolase